MGLFSLTQELAIDLGTANTIIINNGKIVVDEPSIVAIDQHTGKLVAIGKQARQMHGKTHQNIRTIRPLKDGVIADFNAAELMLRGLIRMVKSNGRLFSPSLKMVISIPSGSTNVEIRAVRDSAEHAGGRVVYMIYEPMAAALGAGLDVEAPEGHMVVDIGGGTTEIACISLGGIVCSESINVAGDVFTEDIQNFIRQQHNMRIGERTAEDIKIAVGAAMSELDEEPEDFVVTGPDILTSLPSTLQISGEVFGQNRCSCDEGVGDDPARTLCGCGQERCLSGRRWRFVERSRPSPLRENQDPVPCSGGSSACRGSRYRNCAEEYRPILVLDEINDFLKMNSGAPRCQCLLTAGRAS